MPKNIEDLKKILKPRESVTVSFSQDSSPKVVAAFEGNLEFEITYNNAPEGITIEYRDQNSFVPKNSEELLLIRVINKAGLYNAFNVWFSTLDLELVDATLTFCKRKYWKVICSDLSIENEEFTVRFNYGSFDPL